MEATLETAINLPKNLLESKQQLELKAQPKIPGAPYTKPWFGHGAAGHLGYLNYSTEEPRSHTHRLTSPYICWNIGKLHQQNSPAVLYHLFLQRLLGKCTVLKWKLCFLHPCQNVPCNFLSPLKNHCAPDCPAGGFSQHATESAFWTKGGKGGLL